MARKKNEEAPAPTEVLVEAVVTQESTAVEVTPEVVKTVELPKEEQPKAPVAPVAPSLRSKVRVTTYG